MKDFKIEDFKLKLELLLQLFGQGLLAKQVDRSTIHKWKRGEVTPKVRTIEKFCEQIKMSKYELQKPLDEFPGIIIKVNNRNDFSTSIPPEWGEEEVREVLEKIKDSFDTEGGVEESDANNENSKDSRFANKELKEEIKRELKEELKKMWDIDNRMTEDSLNLGGLGFIRDSLLATSKLTVESEFGFIKGSYYVYFHWSKEKMVRFYMDLYEYDKGINAIKARMQTERAIYEGIVISLETKRFWIFSCEPGHKSYPEMFIFITYKNRKKDNYPLVHGIVAGGSRTEADSVGRHSIPCSSRVAMRRLEGRPSDLKKKVGGITAEQFRTEEKEADDFLNLYINNEIESDDVLIANIPTTPSEE